MKKILLFVSVILTLGSVICAASVFDDAINRKSQVFSGDQLTYNGGKLVSNTLAEQNSMGDPAAIAGRKRNRADTVCKLLAPGSSAVMSQTTDDLVSQGEKAYDVFSADLSEGRLPAVEYQEFVISNQRFSNRVFTQISCK